MPLTLAVMPPDSHVRCGRWCVALQGWLSSWTVWAAWRCSWSCMCWRQPRRHRLRDYPLVMTKSLLWKVAICSGFSHKRWWFSIAILIYQRVWQIGAFGAFFGTADWDGLIVAVNRSELGQMFVYEIDICFGFPTVEVLRDRTGDFDILRQFTGFARCSVSLVVIIWSFP